MGIRVAQFQLGRVGWVVIFVSFHFLVFFSFSFAFSLERWVFFTEFFVFSLGWFLELAVLVNVVSVCEVVSLIFAEFLASCWAWGRLQSPKNRPSRSLLDCHVISKLHG